MVPKALKVTLPSGSYPRPSMTFTDPSRKGPIRSVCVMLCFSPDGRMVHAGPLHTPSMNASLARASFWAAMSVAGSGRVCAGAVGESVAIIVRSESAASGCLTMSVLLECANSIVPGKAAEPDVLSFGNLGSLDRLENSVRGSYIRVDIACCYPWRRPGRLRRAGRGGAGDHRGWSGGVAGNPGWRGPRGSGPAKGPPLIAQAPAAITIRGVGTAA